MPRASRFVAALAREAFEGPPPVWMMRQAGRYLPEYREIRARHDSFLDLCYSPEWAAEVTLQPIRRFRFDAAILFSDILVIPHALGQKVRFEAGEGPKLEAIVSHEDLAALDVARVAGHLEPVIETVGRVCDALDRDVALIGFCGAPWTVATYMIGGAGSTDQRAARVMAYRDPDMVARLVDMLVEASADYLVRQLRAGADAVQIFDTWAGSLPPAEFGRWCVQPARRIVERVRLEVPGARIIGFPRNAGLQASRYIEETGVDGIGIDWTMPLAHARDVLQPLAAVQGNLDPLALLAGGEALDAGVDAIVNALARDGFIFNLGHGILPETPIANVERMLARIREGRHM